MTTYMSPVSKRHAYSAVEKKGNYACVILLRLRKPCKLLQSSASVPPLTAKRSACHTTVLLARCQGYRAALKTSLTMSVVGLPNHSEQISNRNFAADSRSLAASTKTR